MSRAIASGCSATTGSRRGDRAATAPAGARPATLAFCKRRERRRTENGQNAEACGHYKRRFALTFAAPGAKNALGGKSRIWQAYSPFAGKGSFGGRTGRKKIGKQGVR